MAINVNLFSREVRLVGRECGCGGLSPLVGGMLDALPAMRHARVPTHQVSNAFFLFINFF